MKARVENIQGNSRYKVICYENNFYLYDNDSNIFIILFPILKLILPSKLHKIDRSVYEQLDTLAQKPENPLKGKTAFLGGISVLIANIIKRHIGYPELNTTIIMNAIISFFAIMLCILIKLRMTRKAKINMHEGCTFSCFLIPNFKYLIKYFSVHSLVMLFFILFIIVFTTYGVLLFILGIILFGLASLIYSNQVFEHGEINIYKFKKGGED